MQNGVYIVTNDAVYEETVACINSIRTYDPTVQITAIPYDGKYFRIQSFLQSKNVDMFSDIRLVEEVDSYVKKYLPFIRKPNRLRNLCCWLGHFDNFIYIDVDTVVFTKISDMFKHLEAADFVNCDRQLNTGIKHVFKEPIKVVIPEERLRSVFNGGLWMTKKTTFDLDSIVKVLEECGKHPEYFHTEHGGSAQPILNYMILTSDLKLENLTQSNPNEPRSWAGTKDFKRVDDCLVDGDRGRLRYIHWAGKPIVEGGHYYEIWKTYRFKDSHEKSN